MSCFQKPNVFIIEQRSVLSKGESDQILNSSLSYTNKPERVFQHKIINDPIELVKELDRTSTTAVQPLLFKNCEFNSTVSLGKYSQSGSITSETCMFYEDVTIHISWNKRRQR